ncbi:MAG: 23S rRNA pseudouridine(955/2504/2580) synthase RluC [Porticoccaceae bacterium]|nr:23S rRNA pseudouridine(955/2504/2580) synthase RluC [Porticoccaceae bacterium]MDG1311684.1 23S rRNA pseudouridine(955/2504/2580) synthase RluC [Porticoccaceae bacterium]
MPNADSGSEFDKVSFTEVGPEHAGQRLDNFLIRHLKGVPKSRIYRLLRKGEVRLNKGRVKPDTRVKEGDIVRIAPIRVAERGAPAVPGKQLKRYLADNILFEDEGLLIINKPSGLAVHGGSGISLGAIEALRAERPEARFLELVHRLDRDTSGCLMLAKKRAVLLELQAAMQRNQVEKRYQALVKGQWPKGKATINAPLKKNQLSSGERIVLVDAGGKPSVTHFRIAERYKEATLLSIKLETGRTHQIRVHCQFSGQPIAGDPKYGDVHFNESLRDSGLKRLFLHASHLRFRHPLSGDWVDVEAPLPKDLGAVLNKLV